MLWPGSWYMFFRSTSQAYIILVSLMYLFLFLFFFNHPFMVFFCLFLIFFNCHTSATSCDSQWSGCQAACVYIHIMVGVKTNK